MNRNLITAILFTFMVVKNPVNITEAKNLNNNTNSVQITQETEAKIASSVISTVNTDLLTKEKIADTKLAEYKKQVEIEIAEKKAIEEKRVAELNKNRIAALATAGLSSAYVAKYVEAENIYGVPWQITAAVHYVETGQRGDTLISSYAGAQGPMQFMPSTFQAYAQDGDSNGTSDISDVDDAIYTAAKYMASNGASSGKVENALFRYNHDYSYVQHVLSIAKSIGYTA
jgi:membrane-bound lytic murein transglycosylase B